MTSFKKDDGQQVPCGKCPDCRARRASGWSFRLMEEEKRCESAFFLTLTYDPMKVHITNRGFMTLDSSPLTWDDEQNKYIPTKKGQTKRDLQLFFKRLRKLNSNARLRYYAVGEYGGRTKRPHYHILLFNANISTVQKAWDNGQIHYGNVSGASVGYTLKYMSKPKTVPAHKNDDRLPEFSIMSKGLGKSYLDSPKIRSWHKADLEQRMYLNIEDGKKISMPRYYKNKLYTDEERYKISTAQAIRAADDLGTTPGNHAEWIATKQRIKVAYEKQARPDQKDKL